MKLKLVNIAILLVTLFGTAFALTLMPDEVPVHFNIYGAADRWGSKYELLIMITFMVIMQVICYAFDYYYRKQAKNAPEEKVRAEATANIKVLNITFTAVSVLFAVLNGLILYMSYSRLEGVAAAEVDIIKLTVILMGISFTVLGNFMPKIRKNSLVGFRLRWTMYNDVTWAKSNRMSGFVMVAAGIITALCGIILDGMIAMIVMLLVTALSLTVLVAYAYKIYRDEIAKESKE